MRRAMGVGILAGHYLGTAMKNTSKQILGREARLVKRKLALAGVWSSLSIVLAWTLFTGTVHADALGIRTGDYDLTLTDCPTATVSCVGTISIGPGIVSAIDIIIGAFHFTIPGDYDMSELFGGGLYLDSSSIPSNGDAVLVLSNADKQGHGSWELGTLLSCLPSACPIGVGPYGIEGVLFNLGSGGGWDIPYPAPEPTSLLLLGSGLAGLAAWRRRKTA